MRTIGLVPADKQKQDKKEQKTTAPPADKQKQNK